MNPRDKTYPKLDDRFQKMASEMDLSECQDWTKDFPPAPEICPGEDYKDFVSRQTFYAQYRNDIVARRDKLLEMEKQLRIPKAPVGEDIAAAIEWIASSGPTPIEFLTKAYRNPAFKPSERITAAARLLDYVHRKMPQVVEVQTMTAEELAQSSDTAKRIEKVLAETMLKQKKSLKLVREE